MKLLLDFLPLVFFFLTYRVAGAHADAAAAFATHWAGGLVRGGVVGPKEAPVLLATLVVIAATLLQVAWMRLNRRKIDLMLWISLTMVVILGGLTVWLHNEVFIKWKPSVAFWAMGLVFWGSQAFLGKNLLREVLGKEIDLGEGVWRRLNAAWVAYFAVMGLINVWVLYAFSTDIWADFHTVGSTLLSFAFILGQGVYLRNHLAHPDDAAPADRLEADQAATRGPTP